MEFEIPSWNQIYSFLLNLAGAVQKSGSEADTVIGVSRGTCLTSRIMSNLLHNQKLANMTMEFYVGVAETRGEPAIKRSVAVPVTGKKVLVVDDVADAGESLELIKSNLKKQGASEIKIAIIYYELWGNIIRLPRKREVVLDRFPPGKKRNS